MPKKKKTSWKYIKLAVCFILFAVVLSYSAEYLISRTSSTLYVWLFFFIVLLSIYFLIILPIKKLL